MKAVVALLFAAGCGRLADAANLRGAEKIRVPDGRVAPAAANTGTVRSYKPSVPARFRQRGVDRNQESTGEAQQPARRSGGQWVVVSLHATGRRLREESPPPPTEPHA